MATTSSAVESSALYDTLHADHARLDRDLGELLASREEVDRDPRPWRRTATDLVLHVRAVQEVIEDRLEETWRDEAYLRDRVEHARDEQARLEQLVLDAEAARPGPEFWDMVEEIRRLLADHVTTEEGTILPEAQRTLDPDVALDLADLYADRVDALRAAVEMELGGGAEPEWRAEDLTEEREVGHPSRARSPKGGGEATADVSTVGARHEKRKPGEAA